ncbi:MAG: hypothetical protein JWQ19_3993 [Subtercola sp.]|nr:hypothetical protein [Subtercola sp.]
MNGREPTGNGTQQPRPSSEMEERTEQATQDNDLTTGHSDPTDGGADNAKK